MRVQSSPHQRLWSETEADDLPQRARRSPSPPGPQTTAPTVCDAPPEPSNAPFWAAGQPLQQSLLDQLPPSEHLSATTPAPAPAPTAPTPGADAYTGEPAVPAQWLQERQAALDALRNEHDAQRNQAMATAPSPGYIGPGWVEVTLCPDESGQLLNPSGRPTVRVVDPDAPPVVIGHDEGGLIYGAAPGRDFEFSDEAFAAHHRAQVQAGAADHAALRTLARLYGTDAASVMAAQPQLWQLTQGEHALNAGPPPAGHAMADAGQLGMLDLYLADPQVAELVSIHGGTVEPARSDIAQEQVRLYGAQRYEQLSRLGNAMHTVRQLYSDAMAQQAQAGGGPGWVQRQRSITTIDEAGTQTTQYSENVFDPDGFTDWYIQQDGVAQRAFRDFYGRSYTSELAYEAGNGGASRTEYSTTFDNPAWSAHGVGGTLTHGDLVALDLNDPPRLNDNNAVGFDLVSGWSTHRTNIHDHQSFFDKAFPIILVAAVSWFSAGTLGPSAAAGMGMTATTTVAGVATTTLSTTGFIVSAAVAGAATSVASGIVSGNLEFKNILKGALSGALTAGLMQEAGATFSSVREAGSTANVLGHMTVGGAVRLLMGGSLQDGLLSGLASGLSSALGVQLNGQIAASSLQGAERFAALTASKVLTSAVAALGSPDDPRYAFAQAFMDSVFQELPTPSVAQLIAQSVIDENGQVRSGVLPDNLPAGQQLAQLTRLLQDKGLTEGEAWKASLGALSAGIGAPGASSNAAGNSWGDSSAQQQQVRARADLAEAAFEQLEQRYGSQQAIPAGDLKFVLNTVLGAQQLSAEMAAQLPLLEPTLVAGPVGDLLAGAARQTATAAGVIAGLFQGVGDSVIGLAGMAKTLVNANLYVLGGGQSGVGRFVPGGRQAMQDLMAMSSSVQAMLREPLTFLGSAVNQRTQAVLGALSTAENSGNAGDWFLYGAQVGRNLFDVVTLVLGAPGLAGSAASVGAKLRAYVDGVQAARTVENAIDLSRSGIGAAQELTAASASPGGHISAGSYNRAGYGLTDLVAAERNIALDIMVNGDDLGTKTEQLTSMIAKRQGWNELTGGKYGSNNGFDHVLLGPDGKVTILLDSKPINNGATQLGMTVEDTVMQLSDAWIKNVLNKLPDTSPAKIAVLRAIDEETLFKGVIGVDKATGQVALIRVNP